MHRRLALLILLLLAPTLAFAAETWYFRSSAGVACGAGDREDLIDTAGSSATAKRLDGTGDTWNLDPNAAPRMNGNWQVCTDLTTGGGGGPAPRVTWLVQRVNSGCTVQDTIISEESGDLAKSTSAETCSTSTSGNIQFADGDYLIVTVSQTRGSVTIDLDYEGAAAGSADSRIITPNQVTSTRRVFQVGRR